MEQLQLLMALSLYISSIQNIPIVLVPATPEQLFGSDFREGEVESNDGEDEDEYEYGEEAEEVEEQSETDWSVGNRVAGFIEQGEMIER